MTDVNFSPEEAAALRDAAQGEGSGAPQRVTLAASDRQAKKELPRLEQRLGAAFEGVRQALIRELRVPCRLTLEGLQLAGPMLMQQEARRWLLGALVRLPTGEPLVCIGVAPRLGYHLIELSFGAPNTPAKTVPERTRLTMVERETLWPAVQRLAQVACRELGLGAPPQVRIEPTAYPAEVGPLATSESGVVQQAQLQLGGEPTLIGLIVTPKALDAIVGTEDGEAAASARTRAKAAMTQHLGDAEVLVVANLGHAELPVSTLAELAIGQTLWLECNQRDPIEVLVEGQPKFLAMPMQRAGAVGVQIVTRTP